MSRLANSCRCWDFPNCLSCILTGTRKGSVGHHSQVPLQMKWHWLQKKIYKSGVGWGSDVRLQVSKSNRRLMELSLPSVETMRADKHAVTHTLTRCTSSTLVASLLLELEAILSFQAVGSRRQPHSRLAHIDERKDTRHMLPLFYEQFSNSTTWPHSLALERKYSQLLEGILFR